MVEESGVILLQFEEWEQNLNQLLDKGFSGDEVAAALQLVQELEGCVTRLAALSSLPSRNVQLNVVKKVLKLCRRGEVSVSEKLTLQLASLFKVTYSLLKGCLDAVTAEPWTMDPHTSTLLKDITEIASLSLNFDPSVLALCWRSVGRVVCGGGEAVARSEVMSEIVEQLCVAIDSTCQQSLVEGDPLLEKRLRSGRFLCSLLLRVLSEFAVSVSECGGPLLHLLLSTHQAVYSVESAALRSKLESAFLLLRDPVVECMSAEKSFLQSILNECNVSPGQHYSWGLCLAVLMKQLPSLGGEVQMYCLEALSSREEDHSCRLLKCVFSCLEFCHQELIGSVPAGQPLQNGQPWCSLSLYELFCTHICLVLAGVSEMGLLQAMERCLVTHLLSPQPYSVLLAVDCLVFMARLGGEEMAASLCLFVVELLQSLPLHIPSLSFPLLGVGSLLNRLLALLPAPLQLSILSAHAPHHSWLWSHLRLQALHSSTLLALNSQLKAGAITWLSERGRQSYHDVAPGLHCLCSIYQQQLCTGKGDTEVDTSLFAALLQFTLDRTLYCHELSLHLLSYLLPLLSVESLSKVSELTVSRQTLSVTLASCPFLKQSASLHLASAEETLVPTLCQCYSCLLSCGDWLVVHHVLECFRHFAEVTPHAGAVESCIPPPLTDTIIQFLHKVPFGGELYGNRGMLHQCILLFCPSQPLCTLQQSSNTSLTAANPSNTSLTAARQLLTHLAATWQEIMAVKEHLSTDNMQQIADFHANISAFLHCDT